MLTATVPDIVVRGESHNTFTPPDASTLSDQLASTSLLFANSRFSGAAKHSTSESAGHDFKSMPNFPRTTSIDSSTSACHEAFGL